MIRKPLALAALASAAMPDLYPASVSEVEREAGSTVQVAVVTDARGRRWVVRAPIAAAAGAELDRSLSLLRVLGRHVPFSVPQPAGEVTLRQDGTAVVHPWIAGHLVDFTELPPGPGLPTALGRAIAALHNLDSQVFDDAGLATYDAETYRRRHLAELDHAADQPGVPPTLLARWEHALEEPRMWQFETVPTHGMLTEAAVLVDYEDADDLTSCGVAALLNWERAQVADPADDFAHLVSTMPWSTFETVVNSYAQERNSDGDPFLVSRARLVSELTLLRAYLHAHDDEAKRWAEDRLRHLTIDTQDAEPLVPRWVTVQNAAKDDHLLPGGIGEVFTDPGEDDEAGDAPSPGRDGAALSGGAGGAVGLEAERDDTDTASEGAGDDVDDEAARDAARVYSNEDTTDPVVVYDSGETRVPVNEDPTDKIDSYTEAELGFPVRDADQRSGSHPAPGATSGLGYPDQAESSDDTDDVHGEDAADARGTKDGTEEPSGQSRRGRLDWGSDDTPAPASDWSMGSTPSTGMTAAERYAQRKSGDAGARGDGAHGADAAGGAADAEDSGSHGSDTKHAEARSAERPQRRRGFGLWRRLMGEPADQSEEAPSPQGDEPADETARPQGRGGNTAPAVDTGAEGSGRAATEPSEPSGDEGPAFEVSHDDGAPETVQIFRSTSPAASAPQASRPTAGGASPADASAAPTSGEAPADAMDDSEESEPVEADEPSGDGDLASDSAEPEAPEPGGDGAEADRPFEGEQSSDGAPDSDTADDADTAQSDAADAATEPAPAEPDPVGSEEPEMDEAMRRAALEPEERDRSDRLAALYGMPEDDEDDEAR